ncbi:MAG: peptide-N-glycosidase F-related protein [Bacteroidota bacterium]|nr:peptide-N-glycosidase F-related protein [Bacteroidota bacterium]
MKKCSLVLFFFLVLCLGMQAQEETFSVLVHNRTHLQTREEYSQKVLFPVKDKKIKDITLDFSLNCPEKKCSDWDYSISILLRPNNSKATYQLGRMITPYSGWYNQGENASKWDYHLQWNITEYLPLMKDSVEIIVSYEGYQDGFLASTNFIFTQYSQKEKATQFLETKNIYFGYYPFGREDSSINEFLPEKTISIPKGTKQVLARMTVSGHGGDRINAAAEFLEKSYTYVVNGKEVSTQSVWRDDCGCNPIQPQGGTWIYNRSGWCPGTKVNEYYYDLTPFIKDNKLNINLFFEYYNGQNSGEAGYQIANDLFFIGDKNYKHREILEEREFKLEPIVLPKEFILVFKTNNEARNKWYIQREDTLKTKLYERSQFETNKIYANKIRLEDKESYILRIIDEDCDGLSWWANPNQGDGYVLIYDKDSTELLYAFEPDFGCQIYQPFVVRDENIRHKDNNLVALQDKEKKEFRIIFFCKEGEKDALSITIKNRKTGEEVYNQVFDSKNKHDINIDCKDFEKGYYQAKITCNGWTEYKMYRNLD